MLDYPYKYIRNFVGTNINAEDMSYFDCCSTPHFGLLIPTESPYTDKLRKYPRHRCYTLFIFFEKDADNMNYYYGELFSPNVPHENHTRLHHYCLLFEKEYFEERFKMYSDELENYDGKLIKIYGDMLKILNTFALEYCRDEPNSEIVLDAQAEIITHKVIRSILCNNISDAMPVSNDYSVAAAQNYMEFHYSEDISIAKLVNLGYELVSCFMRRFKKETGVTPMEYLENVKMKNAKALLKKSELSIQEIAEKCGFITEEKFRSRFIEKFKIPPDQYRDTFSEIKESSGQIKSALPF